MEKITLTEKQKKVLKYMAFWLKSDKKELVFGGAAGVGKTTILKYFAKYLRKNGYIYDFSAYTGKACDVLGKKGIPATTLHSLLYDSKYDYRTQQYIHVSKGLPSGLILIVDEASMVSESIYNEIMKYDVKILFVGDPFQLPPINSDFNIMTKRDVTLTEIIRQAEESPIIKLATDIRLNNSINLKGLNHPEIKIYKDISEIDNLSSYDQVLCATNKTRIDLNKKCRDEKGFKNKESPEVGDKVICKKNNKQYNIFNGQQFEIESIQHDSYNKELGLMLIKFKEEEYPIPAINKSFNKNSYKGNELRKYGLNPQEIGVFDYSYAITTHSSQGSEWDKILILDDLNVFNNKGDLYLRRWWYTAITRSAKEVHIVTKNNKLI
tara:strand:+ start:1962 stop:3101 length:1140 start_codon:yes stop_codon:yes gene_type:complete